MAKRIAKAKKIQEKAIAKAKAKAEAEQEKKAGKKNEAQEDEWKFGAIGKIDFSRGYWKALPPVLEDRSFRLSVRALSVFCEPLIVEHKLCTHYLMKPGLGVVLARAFGQPVVRTIGAVWSSVCRFLKSEVAEDSPFIPPGTDPSNFVDLDNQPMGAKTIAELQALGKQTTRTVKTLLDFPLRVCALKITSQIPYGTQQLAGLLSPSAILRSWAAERCLSLWQAVVSLERYGRLVDDVFMATGAIRENHMYRAVCTSLESELLDTSLLDPLLNIPLSSLAPKTERFLLLLFEKSGNNSKSVEDVFCQLQKYAQHNRGQTGRVAYSRLMYLVQASQTKTVVDLEKEVAGDEGGKQVVVCEDDEEIGGTSTKTAQELKENTSEFEFHEVDFLPQFYEVGEKDSMHERPAKLQGELARGRDNEYEADQDETDGSEAKKARSETVRKTKLLQSSQYMDEKDGISNFAAEINTVLMDNKTYSDFRYQFACLANVS